MPFLPDLSQYTYSGDELVGGIMCQKFSLNVHHGTLGTMDDHLSFYWDAVLGKPVRWHMHSRHVTFGSHTDEYIMDYLSFQSGSPAETDLRLPSECKQQLQAANISIQIHGLLAAAHAASASASEGKAVFEHNVRLIEELNQRHAGHAAFSGNRFLDMTAAEVLRFRGGKTR